MEGMPQKPTQKFAATLHWMFISLVFGFGLYVCYLYLLATSLTTIRAYDYKNFRLYENLVKLGLLFPVICSFAALLRVGFGNAPRIHPVITFTAIAFLPILYPMYHMMRWSIRMLYFD